MNQKRYQFSHNFNTISLKVKDGKKHVPLKCYVLIKNIIAKDEPLKI